MPAETVSCSWTRDPTRTVCVWHSVPEVELTNVKQAKTATAWRGNTDAGITSAARISLTNWQFGTYLLKLPTHRNLQCVKLQRQVKQTDMSISYRRLLKPKKCHKTIEFRFEVIVLVSLSFYLHCRFRFR